MNEVCFDGRGEHIASCSDDGTVSVHSLCDDGGKDSAAVTLRYGRPVRTVALDPEYGTKRAKQLVAGGDAGQLVLNSRGWMGSKDQARYLIIVSKRHL